MFTSTQSLTHPSVVTLSSAVTLFLPPSPLLPFTTPPLPPHHHHHHQVGTLEYMAPEVLLKEPHSPAADVFALAVTLNEMATGAIPYSDCTRDNPLAHTILEMGYGRQELAAAVAAEGLRPSLPPDVLPQLAELLVKCWARRPEERPSAAEVAAVLKRLASDAEAEAGGAVEAAAESRDGISAAAASEPMPVDGPTHGLQLWDVGRQAVADAGAPGFAQPAAAPAVTTATSAAAAAAGDGGSPGPGSWLAAHCSSAVGSGQAAAAVAPPTVFSGSYLTAGSRDKMEDFVTVLEDPFGTAGYHGCTALGVFDGHRWGRLRHGLWAAGRELSCNRGLNNNISLLRAWVECWKGWLKRLVGWCYSCCRTASSRFLPCVVCE